MKKIALTSLLAVFAAAGANAANTFDGNPLYMPQKGHFYSETSLSSDTNNVNAVELGEEFGYGVTDRLAVGVSTSVAESDWFEGNSWNEVAFDLKYRLIGDGAWKLDVMGGYGLAPIWGDHASFLDKDTTEYAWTVGVRGGYVTEDWTLSAHANFIYMNTESFNWGNDDTDFNHMLNLGVAGHWTMSDTWSAVVGADYYKLMDRYNSTNGMWQLTLGLNMNIDDTKYVGAYLTKDMVRENGGYLDVDDVNGYGVGLKFGIDF